MHHGSEKPVGDWEETDVDQEVHATADREVGATDSFGGGSAMLVDDWSKADKFRAAVEAGLLKNEAQKDCLRDLSAPRFEE